MGSAAASSVLLLILNVIQVVFGLALSAVSIWFFVEVQAIASLRNTNHYLLDYTIYWPQAIPWVFLLVGVLVLCVSSCGFIGARKKSTGMVATFLVFEIVIIVAAIVAAIIALTLADTASTDKFIKDTIWDVYTSMKSDIDLEKPFGNIERRLQCCGASGPRDYVNWRREFPISCCDTYYHGFIGNYQIDCDITNKLANERHGCSEVAVNYARIVIKVLAGTSVFIAFLGVINALTAIAVSKSLRKKPRVMQAQNEFESKKVLL